jgi:hypothetical protein
LQPKQQQFLHEAIYRAIDRPTRETNSIPCSKMQPLNMLTDGNMQGRAYEVIRAPNKSIEQSEPVGIGVARNIPLYAQVIHELHGIEWKKDRPISDFNPGRAVVKELS